MSFDQFQQSLWLSSVQLVRLDEEGLPNGIASGCLIDYCGKRLLLTVSHATGDQANWAIQQKYVPGKGTCNYQLGAMNFLAKATLSDPTLEEVDFSYVEVPLDFIAYRQEIETPSNSVKSKIPINVHSSSLMENPSDDKRYGFCGIVMPSVESHFDRLILMVSPEYMIILNSCVQRRIIIISNYPLIILAMNTSRDVVARQS